MSKKKRTKNNEIGRLQTAAHQTAMFLAGFELGSNKERQKLARTLANTFPMQSPQDQIMWTALYAELILLVRQDGQTRWNWLVHYPDMFVDTIRLAQTCLPSIPPAQVFRAARAFQQKNIRLRNAILLAERCGADFIPVLTEMIEQGLVDNHMANTLRRRPKLVTDRTEIGLRCLLSDYQRDHEELGLSLEVYAKHHRDNLGYVPPEQPRSCSPLKARPKKKRKPVPLKPSKKRKHKRRPQTKNKTKPRPNRDAKQVDTRNLHLELDINEFVPDEIDTELVQILLVHVFMRPTQNRVYAGGRSISELVIRKRVTPRVPGRNLDHSQLTDALVWLKQVGILDHGRGWTYNPSNLTASGRTIIQKLHSLLERVQG